jgi:murein DD-endopeptidase
MGSTAEHRRIPWVIALLLPLAGLTACASAPPTPQEPVAEHLVNAQKSTDIQLYPHSGLAIARKMVGRPYRYGGASPRGFDCSGLVYYSYGKAGIKVPRTSGEQYGQSQRVKLPRLRPGDLVFFRISHDKPSHVGIYAGGSRFIHAPSHGGRVSYASLVDPYWKARMIGAGRFL